MRGGEGQGWGLCVESSAGGASSPIGAEVHDEPVLGAPGVHVRMFGADIHVVVIPSKQRFGCPSGGGGESLLLSQSLGSPSTVSVWLQGNVCVESPV